MWLGELCAIRALTPAGYVKPFVSRGSTPSSWKRSFSVGSLYNEMGGEDALVGNVNKLMVTPPGYTGPPKKGHIVFDACIESGNLGRVDYISEFEFDLFIRPDTCNPRFRVWFNFTVENVRETQAWIKMYPCFKMKIAEHHMQT
ncbi:hypothetical protein cypCar_00013592 [Cyprinus carpio]|nr:hypothetical protein cypCar_00013592 [Cyprinus carpio]